MENAFKNYMLTIPHRIEMGTYGPAAREKAPKDRFAVLNKKACRPREAKDLIAAPRHEVLRCAQDEHQAARRCRSAISTPIAFTTDGRLRCFW